MPVALPPGRAKLATKPRPTGSSATTNTMGSCVADLAAMRAGVPIAAIMPPVGEPGRCQLRQAIVLTFRPAVFDRHVPALDVALSARPR